MFRLILSQLVLSLLVVPVASAQEPEGSGDAVDSVDHAQAQRDLIDLTPMWTALNGGDSKGVVKVSKALRKDLSCPQRVPLTADLATIWVAQGYALQQLGKDELVQLAWEQAFSMYPEVQVPTEILEGLSEGDQENLLNHFEQVRRLVEGQGVLDPNVPENLGDAKIFVDGRNFLAGQGQGVKSGEHLAQIVCPQDGLQSQWTDFTEPFDWFAMCPSGVSTDSAPAEEDFFAGGLFGEVDDDTAQYYNPTPTCQSNNSSFSLPSVSLPSFDVPNVDPLVMKTMGGGVGLVLAGTGTYYAWVVPAFDNVKSAREQVQSDGLSQSEADAISQAFNLARYTTLGLLASGTALTAYGTVLTVQKVSVQPTLTPQWFGFSGQF